MESAIERASVYKGLYVILQFFLSYFLRMKYLMFSFQDSPRCNNVLLLGLPRHQSGVFSRGS